MKTTLIALFSLAADSSDEAVIAAAMDAHTRASATKDTPFHGLNNPELRFALTRVGRGWTVARSIACAPKFCALSAAEQEAALTKERVAGLTLEDAIEVRHAQSREDSRVAQSS